MQVYYSFMGKTFDVNTEASALQDICRFDYNENDGNFIECCPHMVGLRCLAESVHLNIF